MDSLGISALRDSLAASWTSPLTPLTEARGYLVVACSTEQTHRSKRLIAQVLRQAAATNRTFVEPGVAGSFVVEPWASSVAVCGAAAAGGARLYWDMPHLREAAQHGQRGSCASSGRAWRLRAAWHSQGEARLLGIQLLPRMLELAASKAADFTALYHSGWPRARHGHRGARRAEQSRGGALEERRAATGLRPGPRRGSVPR